MSALRAPLGPAATAPERSLRNLAASTSQACACRASLVAPARGRQVLHRTGQGWRNVRASVRSAELPTATVALPASADPGLLAASRETGFALRLAEPLSKHCTWGIGGPAKYFAEVSTKQQACAALSAADRAGIPVYVLGRGSNTLFDDRGFDGLVVLNRLDYAARLRRPGDAADDVTVVAGGGTPLNVLAARLSGDGVGGLEFAVGIPGTVGGAAFMNAGAHGACLADVVQSVTICTSSGEPVELSGEHLDFAYRRSALFDFASPCLVLEVRLSLRRDPQASARAREWLLHRVATQPVSAKSAGCAFRNPGSKSAGWLIDSCGLKGVAVGGARVSDLHANFIVNAASATSRDVRRLLRLVEEVVYHKTGQRLAREVVVVPYSPAPKAEVQ